MATVVNRNIVQNSKKRDAPVDTSVDPSGIFDNGNQIQARPSDPNALNFNSLEFMGQQPTQTQPVQQTQTQTIQQAESQPLAPTPLGTPATMQASSQDVDLSTLAPMQQQQTEQQVTAPIVGGVSEGGMEEIQPMVDEFTVPDVQSTTVTQRFDDSVQAENIVDIAATEPMTTASTPTVQSEVIDLGSVRPKMVPAAERSYIPQANVIQREKAETKNEASNVGKLSLGGGINATIVSDPSVDIRVASFGTTEMSAALRQVDSPLRTIVAEAVPNANIEQALLSNESTASLLKEAFNGAKSIVLMTAKYPTPDAASVQAKRIMVHDGDGARLHPLALYSYNADADGDQLAVSLDQRQVNQVRKTVDYLIGADGKPKIDTDFLSLKLWWKNTDEVIPALREMLTSLDISDSKVRSLANALSKAVDSKDGIASVIRWISSIGDDYAARGYEDMADAQTARLLMGIYEINSELWTAELYDKLGTYEYEPSPSTAADPLWEDRWAEDLTPGSMPSNVYDLLAAINAPVAPVERKNQHFRQIASLAKRIKADARAIIGQYNWGDVINWENSPINWTNEATEIMAKAMSAQTSHGEGAFGGATYIRLRVISRVGFPNSVDQNGNRIHADLTEFAKRFSKEYDRYSRYLNASNLDFTSDFNVRVKENGEKRKQTGSTTVDASFRSAFKDVYDEYTMGALFGESADKSIRELTLGEFVRTSRLDTIKSADTAITKDAEFIEFLADLRTGEATKFNKNFEQALKDNAGKLLSVLNNKEGRSYVAELEALLDAMYLLGADAFNYFGFNHIDKFTNSDIGQKMIKARSWQDLGSAIYDITARYRLDGYQKAIDAGNINVAQAKLDELASISDVWGAIVSDLRSNGKFYEIAYQHRIKGSKWNSLPEKGNIVENVLFNDELTKSEKDRLLNEFQRRSPYKHSIKKDEEIASELMGNPKGVYAGPRFTTDFGATQQIKNFKASSDAISAYARQNHEAYVKQVVNVRNNTTPEQRQVFFERLANNQVSLFAPNRQIFVDAIFSPMEASYASSEKSKQESAVNSLFVSNSYMRNFGLWSDVAYADDFFLGRIAIDRFLKSPPLIAKILSDPAFSIEIYDANGTQLINREVLTGGTTDAELWDYLEENPRLAMALRTTTVAPNNYGDSLTATSTLSDSILSISEMTYEQMNERKLYSYFTDKPGFGGLIALSQKTTGRLKSQSVGLAYSELSNAIYSMRILAGQGQSGIAQFISEVEQEIGEFSDELILRNGEVIKAIDVKQTFITQLSKDLSTYISAIRDMGLEITTDIDYSRATLDLKVSDRESVLAYFNTLQTLSGAKTDVSTGVNGEESNRNAVLAVAAKYIPPRCDSETITIHSSELQDYMRRRTADGTIIDETTLDEIIAKADEAGNVEIEDPTLCTAFCACERHSMADPSTSSDRSITALARFFLDKRSLGTEDLNLKVKSTGNDGSDSISKHNLSDPSYVQNVQYLKGLVKDAYQREGMNVARQTLAEHLYEHNSQPVEQGGLGYDTLNIDDFVNIAQLMIREVTNEETNTIDVELVSLGQLSYIAKNAIENTLRSTNNLGDNEIMRIAIEAMQNYDPSGKVDIRGLINQMKVPGQNRQWIATVEQRRSSQIRNLNQFEQIMSRLKNKPGIITSEAKIRELRVEYASKYPAIAANKKFFTMDTKRNYENEITEYPSERHGYQLLGVVGGSGIDVSKVPGPRTAWFVTNNARTSDVDKILKAAKSLGVTVLFENARTPQIMQSLRNADLVNQVNSTTRGGQIISFFDLELNARNTEGSEGAYDTGVFTAYPDNIQRIVEDQHNSFRLTDSDIQALQSFYDIADVYDSGEYKINIHAAFSNYIAQNDVRELQAGMPAYSEISDYIVNNNGQVLLDIGEITTEGDTQQRQTTQDIARYIEKFENGEVNDNGFVKDAEPNDIVGWLRLYADGQRVWHPVRMYDLREGKGSPDSFDLLDVNISSATNELIINWEHHGELEGRTFKYFESGFEANKTIARSGAPEHMPYRNNKAGNPFHMYVASASTSGRRLTYQLQQAMSTLFAEARLTKDGYNLAEVEGTFPADPDLKDMLRTGDLRIGDWIERLSQGDIQFFSNTVDRSESLNSFSNQMARNAIKYGINPSDVFASHYNGVPTYHWFRFNVLFDSSEQFRDTLMRFFHEIDPTLVPKGIEGTFENTLFNDKLQMVAPFTNSKGDVFEDWTYVYTGMHFMDSHYSGFSRPSVQGASRSISIENTLAWAGRPLQNKNDARDYVRWALMDREASSVLLVDEG